MVPLAIVLVWFLIGALLGLRESRRGHWHWLWLLGAMAGPLSLPLFRQIEQNERLAQPVEINPGSSAGGEGLRILVGVDGSDSAVDAASRAVSVLAGHLTDLTVAYVADYEIHESAPGPLSPTDTWEDPKSVLSVAAASIGPALGFDPSTVMLSGQPAHALAAYAGNNGYDLVVVGGRGRGLTKRLLGSCALQLAQDSPVPVVVMPRQPVETKPEPARRAN